jgi:hypothetical protein
MKWHSCHWHSFIIITQNVKDWIVFVPFQSPSYLVFVITSNRSSSATASSSISITFGPHLHLVIRDKLHPKAEAPCNNTCHTENIWSVTFFRPSEEEGTQHAASFFFFPFAANPRPQSEAVATRWWTRIGLGIRSIRVIRFGLFGFVKFRVLKNENRNFQKHLRNRTWIDSQFRFGLFGPPNRPEL